MLQSAMTFLLLLLCCTVAETKDDSSGKSCGSLSCKPGESCLQESYPPACENRADTGTPCPEGTTATLCGGAGIACCCEPPPEMTYQCIDATACGNSCDCISCPEGKACTTVGSQTSGVFLCEELPMP